MNRNLSMLPIPQRCRCHGKRFCRVAALSFVGFLPEHLVWGKLLILVGVHL